MSLLAVLSIRIKHEDDTRYQVIGSWQDSTAVIHMSTQALQQAAEQWDALWSRGELAQNEVDDVSEALACLRSILFCGEISSLYFHAHSTLQSAEQLVISLSLPQEVAKLPWEWALHDPRSNTPGLPQTRIVRSGEQEGSAADRKADNGCVARVCIAVDPTIELTEAREVLLAAIRAQRSDVKIDTALGDDRASVITACSHFRLANRHKLELLFCHLPNLADRSSSVWNRQLRPDAIHVWTCCPQADSISAIVQLAPQFVLYSTFLTLNALQRAADFAQALRLGGIRRVLYIPDTPGSASPLWAAAEWYAGLLATQDTATATGNILTSNMWHPLPGGHLLPAGALAFGKSSDLLLQQKDNNPIFREGSWIRRRIAQVVLVAGVVTAAVSFFVDFSGVGSSVDNLRRTTPPFQCWWPVPFATGGLDIAVAPFVIVESATQITGSDDGFKLAKAVSAQLEDAFRRADLKTDVELRPPNEVCLDAGNEGAEWRQGAAKYVELTGADIILSGEIDRGVNKPLKITPYFYVDFKGAAEAVELTGEYELGEPIETAQSIEQWFQGSTPHPLRVRMQVLSTLLVGMADLFDEQFDAAIDGFQKAIATPGWKRAEGKDIAYLLLGNAYIRQASEKQDTTLADSALEAFDTALQLRPDSARAMVGKAGAYYFRAIHPGEPGTPGSVDGELLAEAEQAYATARRLPAPPGSNIEAKTLFGLAQVYLAKSTMGQTAELERTNLLNRAEAYLRDIVQDYQAGNTQIVMLAGHAHARLGLIAALRGETQEAAREYVAGGNLLSPAWQRQYYTRAVELYRQLGMDDHVKDLTAKIAALTDSE